MIWVMHRFLTPLFCFLHKQFNIPSFRIHFAVRMTIHFTLVTLKASYLVQYFEIAA